MSSHSVPAKEKLLVQLRREGVTDEGVLAAMRVVPRERFVPQALQHRAYENVALPIGEEQTISQPYVVGHMTQALELSNTDHVLEIGTGSGYGAAVLAQLAADVVSVELRPELATTAARRLRDLGYGNIQVMLGDGSTGWPPLAPYDAIAVTASAPEVPQDLLAQLRIGGRLVAPVGSLTEQHLMVIERSAQGTRARDLGHVRFVPLLGAAGFYRLDPARRN